MKRLEEINSSYDKWEIGYGLSSDDVEYLFQRLERYEEALKEVHSYIFQIDHISRADQELTLQRIDEALEE